MAGRLLTKEQVADDSRMFLFTDEQREIVCRHYGKDVHTLERWEVDELLDRLIDEVAVGGDTNE